MDPKKGKAKKQLFSQNYGVKRKRPNYTKAEESEEEAFSEGEESSDSSEYQAANKGKRRKLSKSTTKSPMK